MATLFDLAQQYLNRALPETFRYDRTQPPTIGPITRPEPIPGPVAPLLPRPGGNAEGFSVYNPDPNRTRTSDQYSPYNYRQAAERNLIGTPGGSLTGTNIPNTSTEVAKLMDMYPDYYTGPQLTGIPGAIAAYAKASIPGQLIGKGLDALGNMLPVNQRAILENEALGAGIRLDDIGRVVSDGGNINTAENIMAGYNLAKITPETIQKRRDVINENMKDPEQKKAKLDALDEFEEKMFGETGIKTKADIVFEDKMITKDPSLKGPGYLEDAFDFTTDTPSFITDNSIVSNNIIGGTNLNDYDGIMSTYTPSPGDLGYISPTAPITSGSVLADKNINRIIDDVDIPGGKDDGPSSGTIIDAGGTAPDGGYATDYYGGNDNDGPSTTPDYSNVTTAKGPPGQISKPTANTSLIDAAASYQIQPSNNSGNDSGNKGGGKIVCTMMNETYGFGSFRNKIWLKHSKGLAPEYQKGYHKLFLPLVKIAKTNKVVRKILEHIAVHRTIDIRQESRGKVHLLGRMYRKILEPLCYFVGKHG